MILHSGARKAQKVKDWTQEQKPVKRNGTRRAGRGVGAAGGKIFVVFRGFFAKNEYNKEACAHFRLVFSFCVASGVFHGSTMNQKARILAGTVVLVFAAGLGTLFLSGKPFGQKEDEASRIDGVREFRLPQWREPIRPLPLLLEGIAPERVDLGMRLFHDPRLSKDATISCATCHNLGTGGVDGLERSIGVDGALTAVNTPTVFNSRYNFVQFWDGRVKTLAEQAEAVIHNPVSMANNWQVLLPRLEADAYYPTAFMRAYPGRGMTPETVVDAIAEFEKTLVTPSRFDRYLMGDRAALSAEEKAGYMRFKALGCASCHQGINVGGNLFQRFGIMADIFVNQEVSRADLGRFNVTGRESDRYVFKVPTLRNIELTAPYFHDGRALSLESATAVMGAYQLGRTLSEEDIRLVVAFLKTLTGHWSPPAYGAAPQAQGEPHDEP